MEKYKRGDIVGIERENERDENYKSKKTRKSISRERTWIITLCLMKKSIFRSSTSE